MLAEVKAGENIAYLKRYSKGNERLPWECNVNCWGDIISCSDYTLSAAAVDLNEGWLYCQFSLKANGQLCF